jgi:dTDP-glucose pyrophosphorylase
LRILLSEAAEQSHCATVFACWVDDPERYGVIEFDATRDVATWRGSRMSAHIDMAETRQYMSVDNRLRRK